MKEVREELREIFYKEDLRIRNKIDETLKKHKLISALLLRYEKQQRRLYFDSRRLKQLERKLQEGK